LSIFSFPRSSFAIRMCPPDNHCQEYPPLYQIFYVDTPKQMADGAVCGIKAAAVFPAFSFAFPSGET
jgi:hypothetical protein